MDFAGSPPSIIVMEGRGLSPGLLAIGEEKASRSVSWPE